MVETPDGRPVRFVDLPSRFYPFTIVCYDFDDEVVWAERVEHGPCALTIPGFGPGAVSYVRCLYADGSVGESP